MLSYCAALKLGKISRYTV